MIDLIIQTTQAAIIKFLKDAADDEVKKIKKIFRELEDYLPAVSRYGDSETKVKKMVKKRITLALQSANLLAGTAEVDPEDIA